MKKYIFLKYLKKNIQKIKGTKCSEYFTIVNYSQSIWNTLRNVFWVSDKFSTVGNLI